MDKAIFFAEKVNIFLSEKLFMSCKNRQGDFPVQDISCVGKHVREE